MQEPTPVVPSAVAAAAAAVPQEQATASAEDDDSFSELGLTSPPKISGTIELPSDPPVLTDDDLCDEYVSFCACTCIRSN